MRRIIEKSSLNDIKYSNKTPAKKRVVTEIDDTPEHDEVIVTHTVSETEATAVAEAAVAYCDTEDASDAFEVPVPSEADIDDIYQNPDKFIIRESYGEDGYEDDTIVRQSTQLITRDDLVVFAKLQSHFKKNRVRGVVALILSVLLLLVAFLGPLMMLFSNAVSATVSAVEITSNDNGYSVKGIATYQYTVNGTEYTGTHHFSGKNIEYAPKEGDILSVHCLKFAPSFSLESGVLIPGFLQVILLLIVCFLIYDMFHCIAENHTIKKYFRERNIIFDFD